jgi:hypothetical protein
MGGLPAPDAGAAVGGAAAAGVGASGRCGPALVPAGSKLAVVRIGGPRLSPLKLPNDEGLHQPAGMGGGREESGEEWKTTSSLTTCYHWLQFRLHCNPRYQ